MFRDKTSLSASPSLWSSIEAALSDSRFFILLASPEAASSPWVRKEIDFWRDNKDRDNFLIAVTGGKVVWDKDDFDWSQTTALPDTLRGYFPSEPLWVDLTWAADADQLSIRHSRFRDIVSTLAAPIHGRPKDELDSEDVRQHRSFTRVRRIAVAAIAVLMVASVVATIIAFIQQGTAARERDNAQRQARVATSQALAAQAQVLTSSQPSLAINLALYAYELSPTFEARSAMATLADTNRPVRTYFTPGAAQVADHHGPTAPVPNFVALSGDGQILAQYSELGNGNNAIHIYDVTGGDEIGLLSLENPLSPRSAGLTIDQEGRRLAVYDYSKVDVWDVPSRKLVHRIETGSQLQWAAVSPDGRWVVTARGDGNLAVAEVSIWDGDTGTEVGEWQTAAYYPGVRFSGDSTRLLAVSPEDGAARTFDLTRGSWVESRPFPRLENAFVYPDESGTRAIVFDGEQLQVWDLVNQHQVVTRPANDTAADGIDVSADGQTIVVGTLTGQVDSYDGSLNHIAEMNRYQHGVVDVSLSADGSVVASTAQDGSLTVSVPTDRGRLASDPGLFTVVSADGTVALTTHQDVTEVWDVAAHKKRAELPFTLPIRTWAAAADITAGAKKVAVLADGKVSLWDTKTAKRIGQIHIGLGGPVDRLDRPLLRFLPDDRHLVAYNPGEQPIVIDTRDFSVTQSFDGTTFAMSGDRQVLASLAADSASGALGNIWRWGGSGTFQHIGAFDIPGSPGGGRIALDRTGTRVAVTDKDSQLFIAHVGSNEKPQLVGGHLASPSMGIAFSSDGKLVIQDGNWGGRSSLLLWDVASGELLAHWPLSRSTSYVTDLTQVVAGPDSTVVTVGEDGVTRWEVGDKHWHDTLCAVTHTEVTQNERQRYLKNVDVQDPCHD